MSMSSIMQLILNNLEALDPVLFLVEVPNPAQNVGLEKGPDFAPIPVSALIQLALLPIQIFVMACY